VLLTAFFTAYFPARQEHAAERDLRLQTQRMAEMVALGVGVGLELNQLGAVASVVNWAKANPSLAYLRVVDTAGVTIGDFNPKGLAPTTPASGGRRSLIETSVPVTYLKRHLGTVSLGLSLDATRTETVRFQLTALGIGGLALLVAIGLALVLAVRISDPIRRLRVAADRVAAGQYDVEIATNGRDEIAHLGQAFAIMVDRVRESHQQLAANSASLAEARDAALAAARTKADFLAAMSHEIRTPMNGVLGMLGLLGDSPLAPKQADYVRTAANSANALLTIIDDILDFSKIEAGKLVLEQSDFCLRELVEDVAQLLAERAHAKGVALTCNLPETVPTMLRGDSVRVRQILLNLGGNAVKFTQQGEVSIRVTAERTAPDGVQLLFEISDTGIGLSPAVQRQLFQPFVQADSSTTRRFGGTGLGLSISRRLVDLMHGSIGVRSTEGTGSTFWFRLRFATTPAQPEPINAAPLLGRAVLVVDDNDTNRAVLRHYLEARGMRLTVASSAAEARACLADPTAATPDCILIDGAMPTEDGATLARSLRANPKVRAIPLVLLSSVGVRRGHQPDDNLFDAAITKPIRLHDLIRTLVDLLSSDRPNTLARAPRPTPPPTRLLARPMRLLLAEDNEVNQMLAVEILQGVGLQVDVAPNGAEAVDARFRRAYDLILMDVQMPVMDGFEATRAIRRREDRDGTAAIPIIAITANAIEGDRQACLSAGMNDYLAKPFTPASLINTVRRWAPAGVGEAPPPTPADPPDGLDAAIDLDHLAAMLGGDRSKVGKYVDLFVRVTGPTVAELRAAIGHRDVDAAKALAHKIKGSCAMVGAHAMAEAAKRIEAAALRGDLASTSVDLDRLERLCRTAADAAAAQTA